MSAPAEALLDRVAPAIRANLPPGVTPAYFDGFLRRNRPQLVAILDQRLRANRAPPATSTSKRRNNHRISGPPSKGPPPTSPPCASPPTSGPTR